MSKKLHQLATRVPTGGNVRRTIAHSPDFPASNDRRRDGRPAVRIPPGGSLTG